MQINVNNQNGQKTGTTDLLERVFGIVGKPEVIQQAVVAQMANMRRVIAHTKDRSEVRGGGKKPWRQKGTGRARHGSIRSPLWKGGGVTFGPTKYRNFEQKINKKAKRKALLMAMAGKVKDGELIVLDKIELVSPKTKDMAKVIGTVIPEHSSALLVLSARNEIIQRSGRNIAGFKIITLGNINIVDLLNYKYLMMTQETVEALNKKYGDV